MEFSRCCFWQSVLINVQNRATPSSSMETFEADYRLRSGTRYMPRRNGAYSALFIVP